MIMTHQDGIAVYTACGACAARLMRGAREFAPGWFMAVGHADHAGTLTALGWTVTHPDGPDEPPEILCPHAAAAAGEQSTAD